MIFSVIRNRKAHRPTLLVVILHSDDLSAGGSGAGQNSSCIQGFDGEGVNHTDAFSYRRKNQM